MTPMSWEQRHRCYHTNSRYRQHSVARTTWSRKSEKTEAHFPCPREQERCLCCGLPMIRILFFVGVGSDAARIMGTTTGRVASRGYLCFKSGGANEPLTAAVLLRGFVLDDAKAGIGREIAPPPSPSKEFRTVLFTFAGMVLIVAAASSQHQSPIFHFLLLSSILRLSLLRFIPWYCMCWDSFVSW